MDGYGRLDARLRDWAEQRDYSGVDMGYGVLIYPDRWGHGGGDPGFEMLAHRMPKQDATVVALCNLNGLAGEAP